MTRIEKGHTVVIHDGVDVSVSDGVITIRPLGLAQFIQSSGTQGNIQQYDAAISEKERLARLNAQAMGYGQAIQDKHK